MISRFATLARTLALMLVVGSGAVAHDALADTLSDAREKGTIRVGVGLMGTKPFVWQEGSDYLGFEPEIIREVAKRIGVKDFEYVVTEWSTLIPGLKSNRWDLLVTGMVKTEERVQGAGILMSKPYVMAYDRIIVTEDSPIKSEADLKGKVLASLLGSTDSLVAHSLVDRGLAAEVKDFNTYAEPLLALRNKQVDAVIFDQLTYQGYKESMPDLAVVGEPILYIPKPEFADAQAKADYKLGGVAIGMRAEDTSLLDAVNKALDEMDADGTRQKILEKYKSWDDLQTRAAMTK